MSVLLNCFLFNYIVLKYAWSLPLQEPPLIIVDDGESIEISVEYCPFTLTDESNVTIFSTTAYCYCYENFGCDIPGPTIQFYNGSNVSITIVNNLSGDVVNTIIDHQSLKTTYKDLDVTNIHTHGVSEMYIFICIHKYFIL